MKAVRFHQFGGPETLVYEDVPKPVAGWGEVIVQVKACALNHLDLWIRKGIPAYHINLPHVPGCDVSGIVDEVGEGVEEFQKGDRVLIAPGLSCFRCPFCLSDGIISARIIGYSGPGPTAATPNLPRPLRQILS
ncbi:MAG: alcohol dehydrogenase catalytic domain-containing protein [Nitrospiria bacterium]